MRATCRETLRDASLVWRVISAIAPELREPAADDQDQRDDRGRGMAEAGERLVRGQHAEDQRRHEREERHQVVSPPPQISSANSAISRRTG
jgi:hypothetical protein